jgi:signal transduction histidine kinase
MIIIGVGASALSTAVAATDVAISTRWTDQAVAREVAARAVIATVNRRKQLLEDYLLHPGESARVQWRKAGETLGELIAAPELNDPQSAPIVAAIRENSMKVENLFPRLAESVETVAHEEFPDGITLATRQRLEAQLRSAERENLSLASGLERQANERTIRRLLDAQWRQIAAGGLLAVVLAAIWIALIWEVFRPLKTFKEAIERVGGGDKQARANLQIPNEIGEAARAFDATADALNAALENVETHRCQLEIANRELEAFSYSVSHDLRAPLRGMDGFSQALLDDYGDKLDETGKDYLRRVRNGSQKMGRLIDDLLALSRVTRRNLTREQVDLSSVAESVADELKQAAPGRDVEFRIAPDVRVKGDKDLLRIALQNLLGNAWKFTAKKPRARIEFDVAENNGTRAYFIRDDGAGFDMEYADKLFQPFTRLHGENEFDGTGIGLATVQRIIHRHGGRIWAEGAVENGATVYFTL